MKRLATTVLLTAGGFVMLGIFVVAKWIAEIDDQEGHARRIDPDHDDHLADQSDRAADARARG